METNNNNNNTVLACIDGSAVSQAVCDYSSWVAIKSNTPLKLLHTIEHQHTAAVSDLSGTIGLGSQQELLNELTDVEQNLSRLLIKKGQHLLECAKQRVINSGVSSPKLSQRHGSLSESLIDLEEEIGLIVMGIRGESHAQSEKGLGNQLETVIRSLHKPILVVTKEYTEPKKVMLAYDGSESCKKALNMIAASSLCLGLACHIVHVGNKGQELLNDAAAVLRDAGIETITSQIDGKIEQVLADYQVNNDIDIMLMGAFSHNRFRGLLLGSLTTKMLAATNRPLLLLR